MLMKIQYACTKYILCLYLENTSMDKKTAIMFIEMQNMHIVITIFI